MLRLLLFQPQTKASSARAELGRRLEVGWPGGNGEAQQHSWQPVMLSDSRLKSKQSNYRSVGAHMVPAAYKWLAISMQYTMAHSFHSVWPPCSPLVELNATCVLFCRACLLSFCCRRKSRSCSSATASGDALHASQQHSSGGRGSSSCNRLARSHGGGCSSNSDASRNSSGCPQAAAGAVQHEPGAAVSSRCLPWSWAVTAIGVAQLAQPHSCNLDRLLQAGSSCHRVSGLCWHSSSSWLDWLCPHLEQLSLTGCCLPGKPQSSSWAARFWMFGATVVVA